MINRWKQSSVFVLTKISLQQRQNFGFFLMNPLNSFQLVAFFCSIRIHLFLLHWYSIQRIMKLRSCWLSNMWKKIISNHTSCFLVSVESSSFQLKTSSFLFKSPPQTTELHLKSFQNLLFQLDGNVVQLSFWSWKECYRPFCFDPFFPCPK